MDALAGVEPDARVAGQLLRRDPGPLEAILGNSGVGVLELLGIDLTPPQQRPPVDPQLLEGFDEQARSTVAEIVIGAPLSNLTQPIRSGGA